VSINFASVTYKTMLDNFSKVVVRTPVTKSTSNISGDETLTDGTPVTISGAFFRKDDAWSQDKEGLFQGADAILMVKTGVTIDKNDKLSYGSEDYRVIRVIYRYLGTTHFYNIARCILI